MSQTDKRSFDYHRTSGVGQIVVNIEMILDLREEYTLDLLEDDVKLMLARPIEDWAATTVDSYRVELTRL